MSPPLTHFLCLPLVTSSSRPQLETSLALLREALPPHIPQKTLRPVGTLHLSIGMCSLKGKDTVERAKKILEEEVDVVELLRKVGEDVEAAPATYASQHEGSSTPANPSNTPPPPPLVVSLSSLTSMHSPRSTSNLYATPVDSSGRLQRFGEKLRDVFIEKGVVLPAPEKKKVEVGQGQETEGSAAEAEGAGKREGKTAGNEGQRSRKKKKLVEVEIERDLKLHATLVNGVYALERRKGKKKSRSEEPVTKEKIAAYTSQAEAKASFSPRVVPPSLPPSSPSSPSSPPSSSVPPRRPSASDERQAGPSPSLPIPPLASSSTSTGGFSSHGRFDARPLLSDFAEQVWVRDIRVECVALCEMGAKKVVDEKTGEVVDEAYKFMARRELP
ncbi:hypothetical protein JCM8547_000063 [Rhodosporidiobolus lusitaniae]